MAFIKFKRISLLRAKIHSERIDYIYTFSRKSYQIFFRAFVAFVGADFFSSVLCSAKIIEVYNFGAVFIAVLYGGRQNIHGSRLKLEITCSAVIDNYKVSNDEAHILVSVVIPQY